VRTRSAVPEDAETIVRIYNQATEVRIATFETRPHSAEDIRSWLGGAHPVVVVEGNGIAAFAATSNYRPRECYAGVAEFSVTERAGAPTELRELMRSCASRGSGVPRNG
jgi:L-amino acid N-acyltransferase YncA